MAVDHRRAVFGGWQDVTRRGTLAAVAGALLACSGAPGPVDRQSTTPPPGAAPAAGSWPEYMGGGARSGAGPNAPAAGRVSEAWTATVDGALYASPVAAGGRVFAVTENDGVYAFDARTGERAWERHLGDPVPRSALRCGNIDPSGITSTPAISDDGSTIFVSAFIGGAGRPAHHLYALATQSGAVRWDRVDDPPGLDALSEQQRGALAVAGGVVYVPFGGLLGDCGPYKGAVVGVPADGSGPTLAYIVPTARAGGIWAPPGEVVDADGSLLVATGNTESAGAFDHANSVIRLTRDLRETSYWAPADWAALSASDTDLGSAAPVLLPGGLVFQSGKNGRGYLLHADRLGGVGGEVFSAPVCAFGVFGGVARAGSDLYVPCGSGVTALRVSGARFEVRWHAGDGGETPILAYGRAWSVARGAGMLVALDPATGAVAGRWPIGPVQAHFATPAVAGGRVFVGGSTRLHAFTVT